VSYLLSIDKNMLEAQAFQQMGLQHPLAPALAAVQQDSTSPDGLLEQGGRSEL
jgi:hypothetical protein